MNDVAGFYQEFTLVPQQNVTANTTLPTNGMDLGLFDEVRLFLTVGAPTGTSPTLTVNVLGVDPDGGTVQLAQFNSGSAITAAGEWTVSLVNFGRRIQIQFVVGGTTPSFPVKVTGVGKTY
ncbi:MAG: hypothetical protein QJR08_04330 [Bacillota bacterium]|nr:hypothetical protein [Bacillota bacterium]